jgi:hypothetical protein
MEDLTPILDRVDKRLSSCSIWLSHAGRLEMVNSAITPITTYAMCTIKLPKGVIEYIDRARKQCLWRGNDPEKKGGNMVAWPVVQQPKEKGGLGVINLKVQNDALLLKQLNKFYNKADIPWVQIVWHRYYRNRVPHATREMGSFWWKHLLRLNELFRTIARCQLGNGASVCFWEDSWGINILSQTYPRLASFAKKEDASVLELMQTVHLDDIFNLPLSEQASRELEELQTQLQELPYDSDAKDKWQPIWGNTYTAKKFYNHVFSIVEAHPVFRVMWKAKCTPRIKFFIWLILVDRLNTKSMLQRRHLNVQDNTLCIMCDLREEETTEHLFFQCPFARNCWNKLHFVWDN